MSKRRAPWFWNTAVLARVAWLLMSVVLAAYAFQALTHWPGKSGSSGTGRGWAGRLSASALPVG